MAAVQLSSALSGAAVAPNDALCRVVGPQPGPYIPAYSSHPTLGQECIDVPYETYLARSLPCASAASEAVAEGLAALRSQWICEHDALGHEVNERTPVSVDEQTPLPAAVSAREAALDIDDNELGCGDDDSSGLCFGALGNGDDDDDDDDDDNGDNDHGGDDERRKQKRPPTPLRPHARRTCSNSSTRLHCREW